MARRKTIKPEERIHELNKFEIQFEKLLKENEYTITGVREYISKTEYDIEKDGTLLRGGFVLPNERDINVSKLFKSFEVYFNTQKELDEIKKTIKGE